MKTSQIFSNHELLTETKHIKIEIEIPAIIKLLQWSSHKSSDQIDKLIERLLTIRGRVKFTDAEKITK
jgi:hypothetical protein